MTDSRQLAKHEAGDGAVLALDPNASQVERMFAQIMAASTNPDVDAGKMTALVDLQMRMMDYQKAEQFAQAKVAALREMPTIGKRGRIVVKGVEQSKYAKFEDIQAVVRPILDRHGLIITFEVGQAGNRVTVRPVLTHSNGHIEKGEAMPLDIDTTGSKNSTQGAGSAATYGKRHAIIAALNLRISGDSDDDGQAAGGGRQLTPQQSDLIRQGDDAAKDGPITYQEWYKALDTASKGWLVMEGEHDRLKAKALAV